MNNRGQMTFFVILAIVIVALVVIFFAVRSGFFVSSIPVEFRPVYNLYSACIEQEAENALSILGTQGGKIDTGDYIPGSEYAPFSSHLNFLGIPVPYWYYVSGNNLIKENVPSKTDMEDEVSAFLEDGINNCDFTQFYEQGFYIELGDPKVDTKIRDSVVEITVNSDIVVSREDRSARKTRHKIEVDSNIGEFYDIAKDIYNREKDEAFLENYAVDVLRSYAPVDGVKIQCNPEVWQTREVVDDLKEGLESNIAAIKFDGNYYKLDDNEDKYFVVDLGIPGSASVNLIYSKEWPTKVEVTPANEELMIAQPVGNEEGLGVLGFCYVPYHFVYDVSFPVLIQVSDGFEIFQFPVSVIIDNNLPREADFLGVEFEEGEDRVDLCQFKEGNARIYTFDNNLNAVEADVSYKCFDQVCSLGRTEISGNEAILDASIPVCVNGQLIANAEGFAEKKQIFSSNSESVADVVLDREYEIEVELRLDGVVSGDSAVIHFISEDGGSRSAILPENSKIKLREGQYDVSAYVYGSSSIAIPASSRTQCYEVNVGGLFGLFGSTKEECVKVNVPASTLDYALTAGGKINTYILESELAGGKVVVDVDSFPKPSSIEELQYNYQSFDGSTIRLSFT